MFQGGELHLQCGCDRFDSDGIHETQSTFDSCISRGRDLVKPERRPRSIRGVEMVSLSVCPQDARGRHASLVKKTAEFDSQWGL